MPPRILIVDDDLSARQGLEELFSQAAIETEVAGNGAEAIDRISNETFAAILLDLKMPVVTGFEVIEHIKDFRPELLTRVLLVTGLPMHVVEARAPELRDRVFLKPFHSADLVRYVEGCIALHT